MTEFSISTIDAQQAAAVRRNVPTAELTTAFDAGFSQVMRAVTEQGATVTRSPHPGAVRRPRPARSMRWGIW